jgi:hypothetical protein
VADEHDRLGLAVQQFGRRPHVVPGAKARQDYGATRWLQFYSQDLGCLLGAPLAAVADLVDTDTGAVRKRRDVLDIQVPPIAQRPIRVLGLGYSLTMLHEIEFHSRTRVAWVSVFVNNRKANSDSKSGAIVARWMRAMFRIADWTGHAPGVAGCSLSLHEALLAV